MASQNQDGKQRKPTAEESEPGESLATEKTVDIETLAAVVDQILIERSKRSESLVLYSGPLPPAEECRRYEEICPNFTSRALAIAELSREQSERRDSMYFAYKRLCVKCATGVVLAAAIGGIVLLAIGKDIAGFSALIIGLAFVCVPLVSGGARALNPQVSKGKEKSET